MNPKYLEDFTTAVDPPREEQPNLGLATTEQLIDELYARMDVNRTIGDRNLPLDYRTVDSE